MLRTKFEGYRPVSFGEERFLKDFIMYGHGGHLGHKTMTIKFSYRH